MPNGTGMRIFRASIAVLLLAGVTQVSAPSPVDASPLGSPGVGPQRVKIGIHAPFTGAAPLPSSSVEKGADLYFRWLEKKGIKINGRYVDVVIKNDNSNPSQAVGVCKDMVENASVFMLVGLAGVDQIQACGRYAASVGVPYVSWGGTEHAMANMPRYFAASMSYEKQAALIADLLVARHNAKDKVNAIVRPNSPNYQGAHDRFIAAMERKGARVHYDRSYSNNAGNTDAQAIAAEMSAAGVDNVFFLGRTVFWIQLENASRTQNENFRWVSVAQTFGTDDVVRMVCRSDNALKASMLSYVPAYKDRDRFDSRHDKAMRSVHGENGDDTTWAGWAMGRDLAAMLRKAPRKLTRRSFTRTVTDATIRTGVGPPLPYKGRGSFAARQAHLVGADCSIDRWDTKKAFASGF